MTDSQQLLAEYARNGSDGAFRELVARFVDLVYSTALRLVEGDTHRAEDVTQTVFLDLARKARTLPADVKLGGWLHRDTCLAAGHAMRGERRRQSREREAVEMNALENTTEADFSEAAPMLDTAINELEEADRTAIILRFFEQKDFRSIGQALDSSEDAARMRVTRALGKLEDFLKREGVTTSAASLGLALTANAVQAAPAGLAATISTAAALAGTTITITATKAAAMTAFQKTIIGTTLMAALGTSIYHTQRASRLRHQVENLQQQQSPLAAQNQQLQSERDDATNQLAIMRADNDQMKRNTEDLLKLRGEVGLLRGEVGLLRGQTNELEMLRKENRWLQASWGDTHFPKSSWKFAGLATPEATWQSFNWALLNGNIQTISNCWASPETGLAYAKRYAGKSQAEVAADMNKNGADVTGYRIVWRHDLADGGVVLAVQWDGANAPRGMLFGKIGDEWKFAPGQH